MTILTDTSVRPGEFILSEGPGTISRDQITIAANEGALKSGTVLGKITHGAATAAAYAGNTGNGTMGSITLAANVKPGVYKLTVIEPGTDAGKFIVEDPDGINIGVGTVAVAFSAGGLGFTLADGATDFVAGDGFNITVAAGSGKYVAYDNTATDGSEVAAGILYASVPASDADQPAIVINYAAEVSDAKLTGLDAGATADLRILGIKVR